MAQQLIGLGTAPDDGTGDPLRVGGTKINENFTELYGAVASGGGGTTTIITSSNDWKDSVVVATTANIALTGEQTIDGVLTAASRVLVKNQNSGAANGIYTTGVGAWVRTPDADESLEINTGMTVYVEGGTVGAGKIYVMNSPGPIVLGTTVLTFVETNVPLGTVAGKVASGTTYDTVPGDVNKRIYFTNAAAKAVTLQGTGASNAYQTNAVIELVNIGAGLLTISGNAFTPNAYGAKLTVPQYHGVRAVKRSQPSNWEILGILPLATTAEFRGNTTGLVLSTDQVWASAAEVVLADVATVVVNMSTFLNARLTLAGNRTLGTPSNAKVGQSGCIRIIQDVTGGRTLAYNAQWEFAGGTDPVLSTAPAAEDLLFYHVLASNRVFANLVKAIG